MLERFEYEGLTFSKENMEKTVFVYKEFYSCKFIGCSFIEKDLTGTTFEDCLFENCNLSLCILHKAKFRNVDFKETKLVGLNFKHCDNFIFDVSFKNCMILRCNFSKLKMNESVLVHSKVNECDFVDTDLSKADFANTDLDGSIFDNTILIKSNFQNAINYSINPLNNKIAGARFSMPEVTSLLHIFDIVIE